MRSYSPARNTEATRQAWHEAMTSARSIGGNSFPSMFVEHHGANQSIPHHYTDAAEVLRSIETGLAG